MATSIENVPDELLKQKEELQKQYEELKVKYDESDIEEDRPFCGCILQVCASGRLSIHKRLMNSDNVKAFAKFIQSNTAAGLEQEGSKLDCTDEEKSEKPIYSKALKDDLKLNRRAITRLVVAKQIKMGHELMRLSVCREVFRKRAPVQVSLKVGFMASEYVKVEETRAAIEWEALKNELLWIG